MPASQILVSGKEFPEWQGEIKTPAVVGSLRTDGTRGTDRAEWAYTGQRGWTWVTYGRVTGKKAVVSAVI